MALKSGHLPRRGQLVLLVAPTLSGGRGSTHVRSRRNSYPSRAHIEHVLSGTPSLGWWATPQWMHMLATGAVVDHCLAFWVWTIVCRSSLLHSTIDAVKNLFTSRTSKAPARSTGLAAAAATAATAATATAAATAAVGGSGGPGSPGSLQSRFKAQTARLRDIQRV